MKTSPAGSAGYCLFDTAFGRCGLAWSAAGVTALQLPCADDEATAARLCRTSGGGPASPPTETIRGVIADLEDYFTGAETDFSEVVLDLSATSPALLPIYAAARGVRWGETATYGDLARRTGSPGAARLVGQAMARNPVPIIIPCHRIVAAGGRLGGFSAYGGTLQKERLLVLERIRLAL